MCFSVSLYFRWQMAWLESGKSQHTGSMSGQWCLKYSFKVVKFVFYYSKLLISSFYPNKTNQSRLFKCNRQQLENFDLLGRGGDKIILNKRSIKFLVWDENPFCNTEPNINVSNRF